MKPFFCSPWFFTRNSIDLLEDEYESVFLKHKTSQNNLELYEMEAKVIDEQIETEEQFEREVKHIIKNDEFGIDKDFTVADEINFFNDNRSVKEIAKEDILADPLYTRAYQWASGVHKWTGKYYFSEGMKEKHLFRAHINAYLVPAKISFAQIEESSNYKAGSLFIALKEYELALIYLYRTLESIMSLPESITNEQCLIWYEEAGEICVLVEQHYEQLGRAQRDSFNRLDI